MMILTQILFFDLVPKSVLTRASQVVSRSGEVTYEDVWLFGHREQEASCSFTRIDISPVLSTTAPPQVTTSRKLQRCKWSRSCAELRVGLRQANSYPDVFWT